MRETLLKAAEPPICYTAGGLQPGTQYAYEVNLPSGQKVLGTFHTPPVSPLRVVALSCDLKWTLGLAMKKPLKPLPPL
jgi:phosphodiesterase/alkaline phosphatase D-like protein